MLAENWMFCVMAGNISSLIDQVYTRVNCFGLETNQGPFSQYRIGFAVHTQVDESEIKSPWFGHTSGDFESEI